MPNLTTSSQKLLHRSARSGSTFLCRVRSVAVGLRVRQTRTTVHRWRRRRRRCPCQCHIHRISAASRHDQQRRGRKEGSEVEGPAAFWCFSVELPEQTRYSDRQKTNSQLTEISRPCWRGIHIVYKVIGNRRILREILL